MKKKPALNQLAYVTKVKSTNLLNTEYCDLLNKKTALNQLCNKSKVPLPFKYDSKVEFY